MSMKSLRGVIAAIITPVDKTGSPDADRFLDVAAYLLSNGCNGLNVLGTTGEATSLTAIQRSELMGRAARSSLPLDRMMVGTGAAAVGDAVALTRLAGELGFAGTLLLPPFYYKGVGDDGVINYFAAIVEGSKSQPIPIYLYNFPALSGVPYTPELVAQLRSEFGDRIVGLKDSSGDLAYARKVAALAPDFDVFPSNEGVLLDARGGAFAGCISATANVNSALCGRAYADGDETALATAVAIRKLFDGKQLVSGVKTLMAHVLRDAALADVLPPMQVWTDTARTSLLQGYDQLVAAH